MADWYCSSAAYAAIAVFAPSTAYTVGQIIKPSAPTAGNKNAFRCTTAGTSGTSEPGWSLGIGSQTTTGSATFTCVTGQSAYGWAAVGGDFGTFMWVSSSGILVVNGDRLFISSDHVESSSFNQFGSVNQAWNGLSTIIASVNRGGSVPPAPADMAPGASLAWTGNLTIEASLPYYIDGLNMQTAGSVLFNSGTDKAVALKNCSLWLNSTNAGAKIAGYNPAKATWDNVTVQFGAVGQQIGSIGYVTDLTWINTPNAIQGSIIPTALFSGASNGPSLFTLRGVDLSALTTAILAYSGSGTKVLLDSCKINAGVVRYTGTVNGALDTLELVNCFDGTHIVNERYLAAGAVTTERTITFFGGAADDVGGFSHKLVSTALIDRWAAPLHSFSIDVENTAVGTSKTATVEIVSSGSLNNDDISLLLEYQGTSGSSLASFASSMPTTPVTADTPLPASSGTWNSLPATPVLQKLQVTFTPQVAGRVRGQVMLGKANTTVYVNPVITIA